MRSTSSPRAVSISTGTWLWARMRRSAGRRAAQAGLVAGKLFQRVFTHRLATPVVAGFDGRTLAATATGQVEFLDPQAKPGEVAYAIRANTGQVLSVAMPCDCRVEVLGVEAGSTVFAGDPVLREAVKRYAEGLLR